MYKHVKAKKAKKKNYPGAIQLKKHFRGFLSSGLNDNQIAERLNHRGYTTRWGNQYNEGIVKNIRVREFPQNTTTAVENVLKMKKLTLKERVELAYKLLKTDSYNG